ncbi:MAG: acetate/propionate family kinase [Deltaproteobacteria bacterium]|nr:MAG: acetate/propionate family kinase [Deltaproteobacteria bacterium]
MHLLVLNCGSSSIKADVLDPATGERVLRARAERIGTEAGVLRINGAAPTGLVTVDVASAIERLLPALLDALPDGITLAGTAHRVVHGGERFTHSVRIDDEVEAGIEALNPIAPLHNPANLAGIRGARRLLSGLEHIAVFDTAFHATLPRRARSYALPASLTREHGIRRYGFHGISHAYVAQRAADYLVGDLRDLRLITCHLGNGASVCAVEYGRSIETSMGMTPLEGLVMGTRCGDLDPGILLHLLREGYTEEQLDHLLNRQSGLAGLSGLGNDLRDIEEQAADGNERAQLAIHIYAHRVRKYIGAYTAILGGVDGIVFTGGIGENSALMRHRITQRLDFLGARLDEEANREADATVRRDGVADFSTRGSRSRLLVVATDEEHAIAMSAARLLLDRDRVRGARPIPVAVSARHVHLTQSHVEALFGEGHTLTERNPLSQPGQFACEETVTLIGPKRSLERVRVLGPARPESQVEISRTDEFFLGIDAPVRASGDINNTPGIVLEGPAGRVTLERGVICAWRHIHMTPEDSDHFGVADGDIVEVAVSSAEQRDLVFGGVLIRVSPSFQLEMHIDTDEGNAAGLCKDARGVLLATGGTASLQRRGTIHDRIPEAAE